MKIATVMITLFSKWWCVRGYFGLLLQCSNLNPHFTSRWDFKYMFTSPIGNYIFSLFNGRKKTNTTKLLGLIDDASLYNVTILESTLMITSKKTIIQWFNVVGHLCHLAIKVASAL